MILFDGAFDPLHAGHLDYLTFRPDGYLLHERIVSVASDDAIRAKGREPLLDQATRARVVEGVRGVDGVILRTEPLEDLIARLKPAAYIKGKDWEGKLPQAQLDACERHGVKIIYTDTVSDSSTDRLRQWALADADQGLDRLEAFIAAQQPASEPWQPVTDYSFEARRQIEGPHADLIASCCAHSADILDYGCGPGHVVRMINESPERASDQIVAIGYDPQAPPNVWYLTRIPPSGNTQYQMVVCREVLEHCTVRQVADVVRTLFRLSAGLVYITTRFSHGSVFDAATDLETDPTHITCLTQPFLRALCVLNGGKRRRDLETKLDHMNKGRVLVYEV